MNFMQEVIAEENESENSDGSDSGLIDTRDNAYKINKRYVSNFTTSGLGMLLPT